MKQEDIEAIAVKYSVKLTPSYVNGDFDKYSIQQAFIDGANYVLKHQWNSVEDRLPEDKIYVFAIDPNDAYVAWYDEKTNTFYDDSDHVIIPTYWMEMPEI